MTPLPLLPQTLPDEYVSLVNELVAHARSSAAHWLDSNRAAWRPAYARLAKGHEHLPPAEVAAKFSQFFAVEITLETLEPILALMRDCEAVASINRAELFARASAIGAACAESLYGTPTARN